MGRITILSKEKADLLLHKVNKIKHLLFVQSATQSGRIIVTNYTLNRRLLAFGLKFDV
jgi:hypothetical protein